MTAWRHTIRSPRRNQTLLPILTHFQHRNNREGTSRFVYSGRYEERWGYWFVEYGDPWVNVDEIMCWLLVQLLIMDGERNELREYLSLRLSYHIMWSGADSLCYIVVCRWVTRDCSRGCFTVHTFHHQCEVFLHSAAQLATCARQVTIDGTLGMMMAVYNTSVYDGLL